MKLILLPLLFVLMSACASTGEDARLNSINFKDGVFNNSEILDDESFWSFLKMRLTTDWSDWPDWVKTNVGKKPVARVDGKGIRITFINHTTFLIQVDGYNILTDPIYSKRCSPVSFAGPKRAHRPAIKFADLPKIDVVLISHDHYDHLDLPTIKDLIKRDKPKIYMGLGVGERFSPSKNIFELDWWQSIKVAENLNLTFTEVQHFSGRSLTDRNTTLWGAFVIEVGGKKIYFGGDSGYADHYKKTFKKFGKMDISLLPIGAYGPRGFMGPVHMDPAQAVQAHLDLHSSQSIGMHYGTFQLTSEKRNEPEELLVIERQKANLAEGEFINLELGEPFWVE